MPPLIPPLPPFRIESRPIEENLKLDWTIFGVANTELQAKTKVDSLREIHPDFDFRAVENIWNKETAAEEMAATLARLSEFHREVVAQCGADDVDYLADRIDYAAAAELKITSLQTRLAAAREKILLLSGSSASPVVIGPEAKLSVGDILEDIHSGAIVRVTAVGPHASKGNGFDWIRDDETEVGHCPSASVSCFVPVKKKELVQ